MQIPFPGSCPGRLHYVACVSETKTKPHMSCIWTLKPTIMRLNQGLVIYSVQISAPTSPSHAEGTFQTDIMFSFCQSFTIRHNEKEVNEGVLSWTVARIQIHGEDSNITVDSRPEDRAFPSDICSCSTQIHVHGLFFCLEKHVFYLARIVADCLLTASQFPLLSCGVLMFNQAERIWLAG